MKNEVKDGQVLDHIQRLVSEEHRLYGQGSLSDVDKERLDKVKVELDQCWDLLRQRRALRDVGRDPAEAQVREAGIVENYEQ